MKIITLTQPWATLVAIGAKKIETRSWGTNYRGPLGIHAAKGFPKEAKELACFHEPFRATLEKAGYKTLSQLPLGEIIATCELVDVRCIATVDTLGKTFGWLWSDGHREHRFLLDNQERAFGDYTAGRKAWLLHNVNPLAKPIVARGALSLWEFPVPVIESI